MSLAERMHFYVFQMAAIVLVSIINQNHMGWGPRGVMVKAMDCGIVVSEFELKTCYYVHFRANTLGKDIPLNKEISCYITVCKKIIIKKYKDATGH